MGGGPRHERGCSYCDEENDAGPEEARGLPILQVAACRKYLEYVMAVRRTCCSRRASAALERPRNDSPADVFCFDRSRCFGYIFVAAWAPKGIVSALALTAPYGQWATASTRMPRLSSTTLVGARGLFLLPFRGRGGVLVERGDIRSLARAAFFTAWGSAG